MLFPEESDNTISIPLFLTAARTDLNEPISTPKIFICVYTGLFNQMEIILPIAAPASTIMFDFDLYLYI
jgi:hypothetical protein